MDHQWIAHGISRSDAKVNLICIPYAGAGANIYGKWKEICPVEYSILPLLFPQRETRYREKMPEHVEQLAEMFVSEAKEIFEKPVVLFGHCTGATLAYEIALAADRIRGKKVAGVIASSANEPEQVPEEIKELMCASNEQLIAYLRKEELVEEEMLEDEDFCAYYLPVLQADFKMYGTYQLKQKKLLDCPIMTVYDPDDVKVSEKSVGAWAEYTRDDYRSYHVKGGHYYIDDLKQVLSIMQKISGKI
jgi:medium-chain acyl-[acyl-carrier-protein] hydrolase